MSMDTEAQRVVQKIESVLNGDNGNNGKGNTVEAAKGLQNLVDELRRNMSPEDYAQFVKAVDDKLVADKVLPDLAIGWAKINENALEFGGNRIDKGNLETILSFGPNDPFMKDMVTQLHDEFDSIDHDYSMYGTPFASDNGVTDQALNNK